MEENVDKNEVKKDEDVKEVDANEAIEDQIKEAVYNEKKLDRK